MRQSGANQEGGANQAPINIGRRGPARSWAMGSACAKEQQPGEPAVVYGGASKIAAAATKGWESSGRGGGSLGVWRVGVGGVGVAAAAARTSVLEREEL